MPTCPKCDFEYTYEQGDSYICPNCSYEWLKDAASEEAEEVHVVKDAYGNVLNDGDSVTLIKDLKVKGASSAIKVGLKIKDIRLIEEVDGHNIEAKIKGVGSIRLKSEFVKKSN